MHNVITPIEKMMTAMSRAFCQFEISHSLRCNRQGIMNATGVAATVPTSELNLSREFPRAIQAATASAKIAVR